MIYWNVHLPHTVEHYKTCTLMFYNIPSLFYNIPSLFYNIPFLFKYSFAVL